MAQEKEISKEEKEKETKEKGPTPDNKNKKLTFQKELAVLKEVFEAGNLRFLVVQDKSDREIFRVSLTVLIFLILFIILIGGVGFGALFLGLAILLVLVVFSGSRVKFVTEIRKEESQAKQARILWEEDKGKIYTENQ